LHNFGHEKTKIVYEQIANNEKLKFQINRYLISRFDNKKLELEFELRLKSILLTRFTAEDT